ncbi:MAG: hypothetical protein KDE46_07065 [Caldilineaceae bacterium]|nr:hypothetical protein [Caldilineaceae bacterium]
MHSMSARIDKLEAGVPADLWKREVLALLRAGAFTWAEVEPELDILADNMLSYIVANASPEEARRLVGEDAVKRHI